MICWIPRLAHSAQFLTNAKATGFLQVGARSLSCVEESKYLILHPLGGPGTFYGDTEETH